MEFGIEEGNGNSLEGRGGGGERDRSAPRRESPVLTF